MTNDGNLFVIARRKIESNFDADNAVTFEPVSKGNVPNF